MSIRDPLPTIMMTVSLDDLYLIYASGVADGAGNAGEPCDAPLHQLITTLRGRWLEHHRDAVLAAMEDAPAWLAAQQTLKAREV